MTIVEILVIIAAISFVVIVFTKKIIDLKNGKSGCSDCDCNGTCNGNCNHLTKEEVKNKMKEQLNKSYNE